MINQYKVRMFESGNGDSATVEGTIVMPIERCFSVQAGSMQEVEEKIGDDVAKHKLPSGRVYQISVRIGNPEPMRSVAVSTEGGLQRAHLDPADWIYSEFLKIRYQEAA